MKKILCIMIALVFALSAFAMTTSAKVADPGLELLKNVITDRSLTIKLDDTSFGGKVKDVTASVKLPKEGDKTSGVAVAGHAKILNLDADVILKDRQLTGYFAIFKVNATELINYIDSNLGADLDATLNFDEIGEKIDEVFAYLNPAYLDFLEKKDSYKYYSFAQFGDVNVDFYGIDYTAVKTFINTTAGITVISDDATAENIAKALAGITDQSVKDKFTAAGIPLEAIQVLITIDNNLQSARLPGGKLTENTNAILKMYYKDGKLIGLAVNLPDGSNLPTEVNTVKILDEMDLRVKEITSPADENAFKAPFLAIDITGIVKWIFSLVVKSFA